MRISKSLNKKIIRFFFVIICCYLIASAGVNQVVMPLYYFTRSQEHPLKYYEENNCLYIDVGAMEVKDQFLNVYVSNMQGFGSAVYLYTSINKDEKVYTLLCSGSNSIKKSNLPVNEGTIYMRLNDLDKDSVEISKITASEKRQVDTFSMLKVFFSFILLVLFGIFVSSLKKRYTM